MALKIDNIRQYSFSSADRIFFDANIWIMIFASFQEPSEKVKVYSKAYQEIITAGLKIYTDVTIISEFVNRYARYFYEVWCVENSKIPFKQYRHIPEFVLVAEEISNVVTQILIDCSIVSIKQEKKPLAEMIALFKAGRMDFNDLLISQTCKKNDCILVTDDGDFANSDLHLLTYNRILLGI